MWIGKCYDNKLGVLKKIELFIPITLLVWMEGGKWNIIDLFFPERLG